MSKVTETTRVVTLTDFVQDQPPSVLISETLTGLGGRLRRFTQKVQVPDTDLWNKLMAEVAKGESLLVTVKTIWPDSGPYYTCLDSFIRIDTSKTVPALAAAAA